MKRSRTALALFLGVFGGLLAAVEWTGPVGVASEETSRTPGPTLRRPNMGGCEFLRSLDYCEYGYDACPYKSRVVVPLRDTTASEIDVDQAICEGLDYVAPPRAAKPALKPAGKQAIVASVKYVASDDSDCWHDSCEDWSPKPAKKAAGITRIIIAPRSVSLPPAITWMNGPRLTVGQVALAESHCDHTFDVSKAMRLYCPVARPVVAINVLPMGLAAVVKIADNLVIGYSKSWDSTSHRVAVLARNTAKAATSLSAQRRANRTTQRPAAAQAAR
jgi:hypothetical protein